MTNDDGRTKYYILMEHLKEEILSGKIKAGDKLPSENDLSAAFGVSRHTVRKALAILENEGYVVARHGKGTFCSERMVHRLSSHNIAVITTYLSDYIFPRVIQGIHKVLTENGYSIILKSTGNSRKNEAKALEELLSKPIDGLIIEPSKSQIICRHEHLYEQFNKYEIPYVFIQGSYPQMLDTPSVLMDDERGGFLLTEHLIKSGRRDIYGIFKADDSQGAERHKGYVQALQKYGLSYLPERVVYFHTEDRKQKPELMMRQFIDNHEDMDAVVCYNDQIAADVMRTLKLKGRRIPEDVAVTGYDNSMIASDGQIPLTTIAHPQERLGEMAARLILKKLSGGSEDDIPDKVLIEPELIIRASTVK